MNDIEDIDFGAPASSNGADDLFNKAETSTFEKLPFGKYEVKLNKIEFKSAPWKGGENQKGFFVEFKVVGGDSNGRIEFEKYLIVNPEQQPDKLTARAGMFKGVLSAFGLKHPEGSGIKGVLDAFGTQELKTATLEITEKENPADAEKPWRNVSIKTIV